MKATLVEDHLVDAEHEIAEPANTFCPEKVSNHNAPPITGAGTLRDDLHQPLAYNCFHGLSPAPIDTLHASNHSSPYGFESGQ